AYEDCVSQLGPEFQEFIRQVKQHVDYDCLIQEIPLALTQTLEGVESVAKIVRSMKEFAHPSSEEKSLCDINANISNIMTVARNEWKYVADIELDLDRGLPEVFCHRGEINQVLLNLIVNASHAIKESSRPWGTITIQTQHKENEICISISDTGCGIPSEVRNRIFDPFFTTKDVGTGTGQGLTLAYTTIVERHGGRFDFESTEGIGSRFWFTLPLRPRDLDLCSNHSGGVR
ncbi:MAG: hypothetical protein KDD55_09160, partial [Bdellovibrionales bacterium]|nr:hypothetical protein [Bdellovibrionales bacterium]